MSTPSTAPRRAGANLTAARQAKNDEFYTLLSDIEAELRHYGPHFKGKTVLCNCDDPFESNFFKYFVMNFRRLGIKKLIASCYSGSPVEGTQLSLFDIEGMTDEQAEARRPYMVEITDIPDANGDGAIDLSDVEALLKTDANVLTVLDGNGDFRSPECVALLKEADIVVTNPPFSLFREYVAQLIEHDKKFLIIGNSNAITYLDFFPLIKANKLWLGMKRIGSSRAQSDMYFSVTPERAAELVATKKEGDGYVRINGVVYARLGNAAWFTNLDHARRHENIILTEKYDSEKYATYHNYDAIEVSKVADIPEDWEGEMGVPITFLGQHNPEQFEIVGMSLELARPMAGIAEEGTYTKGGPALYVANDNGTYERKYFRILIKRIGATS